MKSENTAVLKSLMESDIKLPEKTKSKQSRVHLQVGW